MPLTLGVHDVHVRFRLIDRCGEEEFARTVDMLSANERERAGRFVFARDRLMFVAAHAMLREALSDYADVPAAAWAFDQAGNGKPVLAERHRGIGLTFNLAHTHGVVACALSRGADVGVDVESVTSRVHSLDIATRFFSPAEVNDLRACSETSRDIRFTEIWTLKESYIKAIGEGLSHPLATFGFAFDDTASFRFEPAVPEEQAAWQFELFAPTPLHRMAVAVRCGATPCTITAWADDDPRHGPAPLVRRAWRGDKMARS